MSGSYERGIQAEQKTFDYIKSLGFKPSFGTTFKLQTSSKDIQFKNNHRNTISVSVKSSIDESIWLRLCRIKENGYITSSHNDVKDIMNGKVQLVSFVTNDEIHMIKASEMDEWLRTYKCPYGIDLKQAAITWFKDGRPTGPYRFMDWKIRGFKALYNPQRGDYSLFITINDLFYHLNDDEFKEFVEKF